MLCSDCWVGVMQEGRGRGERQAIVRREARRRGVAKRGSGGGAWCARNLVERVLLCARWKVTHLLFVAEVFISHEEVKRGLALRIV